MPACEPAGDSIPAPALVPGQVTLSLEPGYYRLGIQAEEGATGRRCAFKTNVELAGFDRGLSISDILFASLLGETESCHVFNRGAVRVIPHPLHTYKIPGTVKIYFEIYGLDTDDRDRAFYEIAFRIDPLEKRRRGPILVEAGTVVRSKFKVSGYGSMQSQRLEIATENLWQGAYHLKIEVTDRRVLRSAERTARFSLIE